MYLYMLTFTPASEHDGGALLAPRLALFLEGQGGADLGVGAAVERQGQQGEEDRETT